MGKFCKRCGRLMKYSELSHCSDECLLADKKETKSLRDDYKGAESWNDESDVWQ